MRPLLVAALCGALLAPACVRDGRSSSSKVEVVTGVYPVRFVVDRIGGDFVEVVDVAPAGEPHDVELTPTQVGRIENADLVVLVRGLQPALDDAAPDGKTLDLLHDGGDPHIWLDPEMMIQIANQVVARLMPLDTDNARAMRSNASQLVRELQALHGLANDTLRTCERKDIVTAHASFGRFAGRYDLTQTGITGPDPEAEPSPARIAEVAALVKKKKLTTVFAESDERGPAHVVAEAAKVKVAVLDPVEVFKLDDYTTVMRRNLETLKTALGCG